MNPRLGSNISPERFNLSITSFISSSLRPFSFAISSRSSIGIVFPNLFSRSFITGKLIKFYGSGEGLEMLDIFHPERMASRILGMGDIVSLVEKAGETINEDEAEKISKKLVANEFNFNDFRDAIKQMNKLGSLKSTLSMIPGMGNLSKDEKAMSNANKELKKTISIIDSMTTKERLDYSLLNGSRRRRIAKGSGTSVQDINLLVKKFLQMRKMSKNMGKMKKKSKNMLNFN